MQLQSPYLTDETAIITGAGNGIGRALAFEVAAEGARVFLIDSDEQKLADTMKELQAKGYEAKAAVINLSLSGSAQHVVDCVFIPVDLVVNVVLSIGAIGSKMEPIRRKELSATLA